MLFSSLGAFYLFQEQSLPQPRSERKSRGNRARHPSKAHPQPPGTLNSLGAGGQPPGQGLQPQDQPHPAPQASPHRQAPQRSRLAVPRAGGTHLSVDVPLAHHSPLALSQSTHRSCCPTFPRFQPPPARREQAAGESSFHLSPLPEAPHLTERYLHHRVKARFLPFAAAGKPCCHTKPAVSNQPACQELS